VTDGLIKLEGDYFYLVYERPFNSTDSAISCNVTYFNNTTYPYSFSDYGNYAFLSDEYFSIIMVYEDNTNLSGGPYGDCYAEKAGIYFKQPIPNMPEFSPKAIQFPGYEFTVSAKVVKQLDSKFIPNDIARVGHIDNQLAEVERTLTE
jgi:hypothetical protein